MLYVTTPSDRDIASLFAVRADAAVSIYVRTTPITPEVEASRLEFSNLIREAATALDGLGVDERRRDELVELLDEVHADDELWRHQANSLAVFATPDEVRTFRLANHLGSRVEVSDRFALKPLLRATTFEHSAYVVALSERRVRLVAISSDLPPEVIEIPGIPERVADLRAPETDERRPRTRRGGKGDRSDPKAGRERELAAKCRRIDAALAPVLRGSGIPVIVMGARPIASIFHRLCTAEGLLPRIVSRSPDRSTPAQIATRVREVLDEHYEERVAELHELYERRLAAGRTSDDLDEVARAATKGAVETLFVDIESDAQGTIDPHSGAVDRSASGGLPYSLLGEITRRALATGAKVVALRGAEVPGSGEVSATLRFATRRPAARR